MNEDGTPGARFERLMEELEKRFPNPKSHLSSQVPELFYLSEIDRVLKDSKELNWAKRAVINTFTVRKLSPGENK
jgi:hypothetical protein